MRPEYPEPSDANQPPTAGALVQTEFQLASAQPEKPAAPIPSQGVGPVSGQPVQRSTRTQSTHTELHTTAAGDRQADRVTQHISTEQSPYSEEEQLQQHTCQDQTSDAAATSSAAPPHIVSSQAATTEALSTPVRVELPSSGPPPPTLNPVLSIRSIPIGGTTPPERVDTPQPSPSVWSRIWPGGVFGPPPPGIALSPPVLPAPMVAMLQPPQRSISPTWWTTALVPTPAMVPMGRVPHWMPGVQPAVWQLPRGFPPPSPIHPIPGNLTAPADVRTDPTKTPQPAPPAGVRGMSAAPPHSQFHIQAPVLPPSSTPQKRGSMDLTVAGSLPSDELGTGVKRLRVGSKQGVLECTPEDVGKQKGVVFEQLDQPGEPSQQEPCYAVKAPGCLEGSQLAATQAHLKLPPSFATPALGRSSTSSPKLRNHLAEGDQLQHAQPGQPVQPVPPIHLYPPGSSHLPNLASTVPLVMLPPPAMISGQMGAALWAPPKPPTLQRPAPPGPHQEVARGRGLPVVQPPVSVKSEVHDEPFLPESSLPAMPSTDQSRATLATPRPPPSMVPEETFLGPTLQQTGEVGRPTGTVGQTLWPGPFVLPGGAGPSIGVGVTTEGAGGEQVLGEDASADSSVLLDFAAKLTRGKELALEKSNRLLAQLLDGGAEGKELVSQVTPSLEQALRVMQATAGHGQTQIDFQPSVLPPPKAASNPYDPLPTLPTPSSTQRHVPTLPFLGGGHLPSGFQFEPQQQQQQPLQPLQQQHQQQQGTPTLPSGELPSAASLVQHQQQQSPSFPSYPPQQKRDPELGGD